MSAIARNPSDESPGSDPLRVVIADDHPLMLAGIRQALERAESIEIVGEAQSGPETLAMVQRLSPEVVLTDILMSGVPESGYIEQIRASSPDVKIVVLSVMDDRFSIDSARNAGASAYIVKSVMPSDIVAVLRQAAAGSPFQHSAVPPSASRHPAAEPADRSLLTERETTILAAVVSGMTTAAISEELWVSEHTVKFHLTNIYRKLGVANRAAAVRYAIEHDLLDRSD